MFAESLKHNNQNIIVEGHTDNVPIGPELREKYPTNWELSTARSAAVVRYLTEKAGVLGSDQGRTPAIKA